MNKIIEQSLKLAGYNNYQELAKVVNATPNAIAATEMLLGIFEEQCPSEFGYTWASKWKSEEFILLVTKIDSLQNVVHYNKFSHKTKKVYYATEQDYKNNVYTEERGKENYTSGNVRINGYTTEELSLDRDTFLSTFKALDTGELMRWQDDALHYGVEKEQMPYELAV